MRFAIALLCGVSSLLAGCDKPEVKACKFYWASIEPDLGAVKAATVGTFPMDSPEALYRQLGRRPNASDAIDRYGRLAVRGVVLDYGGPLRSCKFKMLNEALVGDPHMNADSSRTATAFGAPVGCCSN